MVVSGASEVEAIWYGSGGEEQGVVGVGCHKQSSSNMLHFSLAS